jgi:hypothetical protein
MSSVQRPRARARVLARAIVAVALVTGVLAGCGGSRITPGPLESSISAAFARLYLRQQSLQGNPVPDIRSLHAQASCQKGSQATTQSGAGDDWVCRITFLVAGPATPVRALYNVNVQTNGCYSADGDGPASVNGTRTITGPGNQSRVNPLWLIDGCFDIG